MKETGHLGVDYRKPRAVFSSFRLSPAIKRQEEVDIKSDTKAPQRPGWSAEVMGAEKGV